MTFATPLFEHRSFHVLEDRSVLEGYPIDEDARIEPNRSIIETNLMRTVDRRFKCDGSIDLV